ncbi:MAG: hypothetical protein R2867_20870 [Caldilineaceae bacterium]
MQIEDIGGAGAVDVGQVDALLVELVGCIKPGALSMLTLAPKRP